MANVTIPGLTLLTSIDRAADLFEVSDTSDSGNSKRTTINSMLDLTSHPVGINDVQTLTNKTLTAPIVSSPVLSGTLTGTYTLGGTPTFPSSVVTLAGSQTLTNKVLTSPTINSPTITNPTITVDTLSEYTSANGVTIDGLNVKDGKLNTNNSVITSNITNAAVTASKLSIDFVEAVSAGFTSAASNTFQDSGLNITLPTAGTWLLVSELRMETPATSGAFVVGRYYNTTAGSAVSNSERLGIINPTATALQLTTPMNMKIVTVTSNTIIRVDIQPGGAYVCKIQSDGNGRSHMMAFRIG